MNSNFRKGEGDLLGDADARFGERLDDKHDGISRIRPRIVDCRLNSWKVHPHGAITSLVYFKL